MQQTERFLNVRISIRTVRLIQHLIYKYNKDSDLNISHKILLTELEEQLEEAKRGAINLEYPKTILTQKLNFKIPIKK